MGLLDIWTSTFKRDLQVIRKARMTFFSLVIVFSLIGSGLLYWLFNWEMWNVINMKTTLNAELMKENERLKSSKDIKQRSEQEAQQEKNELVTIEGRVFSHEQVILDGFSYRNCTFDNVVFLFNGGPGEMNCTVKAGNNGFMTFSKPVERTIKILHALGMFRPGIDPKSILKFGPVP